MITMGPIIDQQHYMIVKKVISPEYCALLSDYARFKARSRPNIKKNIDPLDNVHREYGDPMMEYLLEQLTPIIEKATKLELWPTLSFYYVYTEGKELLRHNDRSSCQFVAGVYLGADEAFIKNGGSWPLVLNINNEPQPIHLEIGDILIFKGHETEHWRTPFKGQWFVSAIFGYVDKNDSFAFQKYDQRKTLGRPHIGMFRWLWGCLKAFLIK